MCGFFFICVVSEMDLKHSLPVEEPLAPPTQALGFPLGFPISHKALEPQPQSPKPVVTTTTNGTPEILFVTAAGAADDHEVLLNLNRQIIQCLKKYPHLELAGKLQTVHYFDTSNRVVKSSFRYIQTLQKKE